MEKATKIKVNRQRQKQTLNFQKPIQEKTQRYKSPYRKKKADKAKVS